MKRRKKGLEIEVYEGESRRDTVNMWRDKRKPWWYLYDMKVKKRKII